MAKVGQQLQVAAKRYRYTGMERDEESGLEYHSARYYVGWLGRWVSGDPIRLGDGMNAFGYCRENPIRRADANGMQSSPGAYQKYFNEKIVGLILASGNQRVISQFLDLDTSGSYRLKTTYGTGFNAGHTVGGDRISAAQQLGLEYARTNQPDGPMERRNPGMSNS